MMLKVFLAEDEVVIRESIRKTIPWEEYGFELAGEAQDGEMALPMIRQSKPDVLFTDIKMPFMDGLTLCKLVRKEFPEMKIVILSGYDEFEYAQQAIALGVERYILKPISRNAFLEVLVQLKEKTERISAQKEYYEQFRKEIQEYEQHCRRDFFELLVLGQASLSQIYGEAQKLSIDIMAESYNIVLFSANISKDIESPLDQYSQNGSDLQEELEKFFLQQTEYLLFRYQMFCYAVLMKGKKEEMESLTKDCIKQLKELFEEAGRNITWSICAGQAVNRLSNLSGCYDGAARLFAFRYVYENQVITQESMELAGGVLHHEETDLNGVDVAILNTDTIAHFLGSGLQEEVEEFVKNYFLAAGESAIKSKMFRQYLLLNIHFNAIAFLQKIGIGKEKLKDGIHELVSQSNQSVKEAQKFSVHVLNDTIQLRDENMKKRYRNVIQVALDYIGQHYTEDTLSLNKVAQAANVSSNHFSALFSQEMQQTFIEYLTGQRMKKAKELLRSTDLHSGEIAYQVGYRDSHYFSYLFKKWNGITPSDYRNQKDGENFHEK